MVHQWVKLALPASKLSGKPAPDVAKDPGNPQRMVWDSTNYAGMGNGAEGRSAPHKSSITLPNGEVMYGYEKESSEGREGNLNELVFHLFGQLVLPGAHPRIKLIEHKISDEQSSYTLFIESIGENQSLLALCKELGKNTDVIPNINLVNLGCSIALAALIQSGDAFLKNFVVTNHANGQYAVYPIDFEVRDESGAIRFIDLTAQSTTAMKKMLTHGGILDYKTEFTFGENLRQANGAESTAGIGDGLCDHGRDVFAALITEGSKDIESDQILKMYQRIATLSDDDINELLNPISFVMTKKEKEKYHRDLMSIVHETQNYLKSVGKEPTTPDSDENTSSMQNK
ncbi:MAG: hypothetical protein NXI01_08590 [Gammaproteobacteria bacterium]|nr:hypothetical protein [Gammaproteobacteria bacterium]